MHIDSTLEISRFELEIEPIGVAAHSDPLGTKVQLDSRFTKAAMAKNQSKKLF